jgi:hypothetical protein
MSITINYFIRKGRLVRATELGIVIYLPCILLDHGHVKCHFRKINQHAYVLLLWIGAMVMEE